jgi:polyisoprenoid-binding protein YceI
LDEVLRGLEFLNVKRHPAATFRSTQLNFDGEQLLTVDGVLTMLGVSRPLTLTVTHYKCG